MNPWLFPWWQAFQAPFSGDVSQTIEPQTRWWSPELEFNFAGNRDIESDVVGEVASYGRQLGILSEAVMELANNKPGEATQELRQLMTEVEAIKLRHASGLKQRLQRELQQLAETDPDALQELLDRYRPAQANNK